MKKCLLLLLAAMLMLSACGCKAAPSVSAEPAFTLETDSFQVGYSRKIMNPSSSVPLAGYSNALDRYATEIGEDITCTAVAISDGLGGHVLLITTDLTNCQESVTTMLRQAVAAQTGIAEDNIIITATHTHSAPDLTHTSLPEETAYISIMTQTVTDAALEALADRKDATMYTGSIETERMNFIRHYLVEDKLTGDVSVAGDHFGSFKDASILGHAAEVDATLRLIQFKRDEGQDIVLVNWAAHPHFTGGSSKYVLSSDYVGPFRDALEDMTGANVAFFQGAAGDINETSRIDTEERTTDYRTYGALLADYAAECLSQNMEQLQAGPIKIMQVDLYGQINHTQDDLYLPAQAVYNQWTSTYKTSDCTPLMEPYGIRSVYHAIAIVGNYKRSDADGRMSLKAVSIGDELALLSFPGELFSGLFTGVEQQSPFKMTMLLGYADHHVSYLPTQQAYEYTCYESDISRFAPGTGEQVQEEYIRMLQALTEG